MIVWVKRQAGEVTISHKMMRNCSSGRQNIKKAHLYEWRCKLHFVVLLVIQVMMCKAVQAVGLSVLFSSYDVQRCAGCCFVCICYFPVMMCNAVQDVALPVFAIFQL